MRESFVFYRSFAEAIKVLDDKSAKELLIALCDYALDDKEAELDNPILKAMFALMKPQVDANNRKRETGKKGGRPKKEVEPDKNEYEEVEAKVFEEDENEKPKVFENENQKKPKVFEEDENEKPKVFENENQKKPNVNGKCIMENVNGECKWEMENVNVNEEAVYINSAAENFNFFEWLYIKLSAYTKEIHKYRAEYDAVLSSLISKYSKESVVSTIKAALEDDFWLNKLFEPKSLERNFAKMKWELVDRKNKNSNLSEVDRALQMYESLHKETA